MRQAGSGIARTLCGIAIFGILSAVAVRTSSDSIGTSIIPRPPGGSPTTVQGRHADSHVRGKYATLPMRFEPNGGRTDHAIDFVARGAGYAVYLSGTRTSLVVDPAARTMSAQKGAAAVEPPARLSMQLTGSRANATALPHRPLSGRTNHLIGNDPRKWIKGIPAYERIEYRDVYPGVDVVYYGNQNQLEYDFTVAPGASFRQIALEFSGQTALSIDEHGGLVIATTRGNLVQHTPVIYQQDASGSRQTIDGGYELRKDGRVGFRVGRYDSRRPLVIDPVLGYSTYLGGSGGDEAAGITVDGAGDVYITGRTGSLDFPLQNPSQPSHSGAYYDAFVLKLNRSGDSLVYGTYLGGSGNDYAADIHVDGQGSAFVVGTTYSPDFPMAGAFQSSLSGYSDIFLTRLDASGYPLYSTYLGGTDQEIGSGLTVDSMGRAYVTGWTFSPDLPLRNPLQSRLGGGPAFKTTDGGGTWTVIQGGLNATWIQSIVIDPQNTATLYAATEGYGAFKSIDGGTSWTAINNGLNDPHVHTLLLGANSPSTLFAGTETGIYRSADDGDSWQPIYNVNGRVVSLAGDPTSPSTVFAAVMSSNGGAGVFKSSDGGETWTDTGPYEQLNSVAVSQSSPSTMFVGTSRGVFKSTTGGGDWMLMGEEFMLGNTYAVAVDPTDSSIVYAATDMGLFRSLSGGAEWTLVGNFGQVLSVAVSPSSPAVIYLGTGVGAVVSHDRGDTWASANLGDVVAWTLSVDPYNPDVVYAGSTASIDAVLARFSADGAVLEFSTYFGGSSFDEIADVQVDATGNVYIAGPTASPDLPVVNAVQPRFGGVRDLFVAKFSPAWQVSYATYIGGSGWEHGTTLALDEAGHVYVAGETYSQDFPRVNAQQPEFGGGYVDAFLAKLAPDGGSFVYSTLLGGNETEFGVTLALGASGGVVVSGTTGSTDFPTLNPVQATPGGGFIDLFVTSFTSDGAMQSSTFLGGNGWDYNNRVAVAADGRIWVTGNTQSTDFPTRSPLQAVKSAFNDVIVARIDPGTLDTTPPITVLRAFGDQGAGGWYVTPVKIEIDAADDGSGVASIEYRLNEGSWMPYATPFFISASGTTRVRTRATDRAGNVEPAGVDVSFNVDVEGPIVTITSPEPRTYLHSDVLTIGFTAADSGSGLAGTPVAGLDRTLVSNGQIVPLLALPLGSHNVSVSARDLVGNGTKQSVSFEIVATIESLIGAVNAYAAQGAIDASTRSALLGKLDDARQALGRGNVTVARNKLEDFINYVTVRTDRGVTAVAADVLITDARYVLDAL
jgi:hypothetical protein